MRSRPYEIARRALPLLAYCGREGGDERLDGQTRALLRALGQDVLGNVMATIDAIAPDDVHHAVRRDLARARRRLGIGDNMTAGGIVPLAHHGDRP